MAQSKMGKCYKCHNYINSYKDAGNSDSSDQVKHTARESIWSGP